MKKSITFNPQAPPMHHYDPLSITGSCLTIFFAFIGNLSINEWGGITAVATGLVTIGYTIFKWSREARKK